MGWSYYWTKAGRRIEIEFALPDSYFDNRTIGSKKHREVKLHDHYFTRVKIRSELGDLTGVYDSTTKFKDIVHDIGSKWYTIGKEPKETNWQPETRETYFRKQKEEREALWLKKELQELEEYRREMPQFWERMDKLSQATGLPLNKEVDEKEEPKLWRQLLAFFSYRSRVKRLSPEDTFRGSFNAYDQRFGDTAMDLTWNQIGAILTKALAAAKAIDKAAADQADGSSFMLSDLISILGL